MEYSSFSTEHSSFDDRKWSTTLHEDSLYLACHFPPYKVVEDVIFQVPDVKVKSGLVHATFRERVAISTLLSALVGVSALHVLSLCKGYTDDVESTSFANLWIGDLGRVDNSFSRLLGRLYEYSPANAMLQYNNFCQCLPLYDSNPYVRSIFNDTVSDYKVFAQLDPSEQAWSVLAARRIIKEVIYVLEHQKK